MRESPNTAPTSADSRHDPRATHHDSNFLRHAHRLATRGLGRTAPNPTVGCVIVKDDKIIGAARTADGGRPHAETEALKMAGDAAHGATAYVTLEPCAHHGKTPPCAEALMRAGVARVVIGCTDPDPRVAGRGIAMLQAVGIEVIQENMPEAVHLNQGFFRRVTEGLPYVSVKLATSADHFMARNDGGGQWLTGAFARQHGHLVRSQHDAILTSIGTVLSDDPLLTVRPPSAPHPGLVRVVMDRRLRIPLTSKLVTTAPQFPLWVITTPEAVEHAASHATDLTERGVKIIAREEATPESTLRALAAEGLTRVLIEAGPTLSELFLASGLAQTLHWYHAPIMLGNTGAAPINALEALLAGAKRDDSRVLGEDTYERYELA